MTPEERARAWLTDTPYLSTNIEGEKGFVNFPMTIATPEKIVSLAAELHAVATESRAKSLGLLMDAWMQWACVVDGFDSMNLASPRFDGCLTTLEDIRAVLAEEGLLKKYPLRPEMDWWIPMKATANE